MTCEDPGVVVHVFHNGLHKMYVLPFDCREHIAEYVLVTQVAPHPRADRLELVYLKSANGFIRQPAVAGRGEFISGDTAAYFTRGSYLPTDVPEFHFLKYRETMINGRPYHDVQPRNLMGIVSPGVLMRVRQPQIGESALFDFDAPF